MSAYLSISRLTKIYATPKGSAVVVRDFDLEVSKGEFVCLIGHSGCGKTTVLSMLAGLNEVTSGVMVLAGKNIKGPGPVGSPRFSLGQAVILDELIEAPDGRKQIHQP
jgi:nitrate/nitrite transport system ATP-binding protein